MRYITLTPSIVLVNMLINSTSKFTTMRKREDLDKNKEYIINSLLSGEKSPTDICVEFNCKYDTLRARTKKWIPNYKPDYTSKIRKCGGQNKHLSLEQYYLHKDKKCKRSILHRLLVEERGNFCSECGVSSVWNNKPLRLQVDHFNGECYDNRPSNLRLLCPNCHSQTETFSSKQSLARVV